MVRIHWRGLPNASWARAILPHRCAKCKRWIIPGTYAVVVHPEKEHGRNTWYCSVAHAKGLECVNEPTDKIEKDPYTAFMELCEEFDNGWRTF